MSAVLRTPHAWPAPLPPLGWNSPELAPPAPGRYERLTPCLGVTVDVWDADYCCWRRTGHEVERGQGRQRGVICANQDLPWRPLPRISQGQH